MHRKFQNRYKNAPPPPKKREKGKTPIKSFLEFCCHFEDFIRMNICNPKEKVKSIRFFKVTWLFFSPNFSIFLITAVTVKIDTFESWQPAIDCKGLMLFLISTVILSSSV